MVANILDGHALARTLKEKIDLKLKNHIQEGWEVPCLALLKIGDNQIIKTYFQSLEKIAHDLGINTIDYNFQSTVTEKTVIHCLQLLNADDNVNGILIGFPIYDHLNSKIILNQINPLKDVDCCTAINQGCLINGTQKLNSSCCMAVLEILKQTNIELRGKTVTIIGASMGKLMALNFLNKDCTITICNKYTQDLTVHTKMADIVISMAGAPNLIKGVNLKPACMVIDVGTTHTADGHVQGDVEFESAKKIAAWITPVPGGVGPVTNMMVLNNLITALELQHSLH